MKKEFSIYLDLVRFLAALAVVIYHSNMRAIVEATLPFSQHGHAAVIVFFVLSGYVISYIASSRESQPVDYWSSRLSRFYSLAIPVVLLTPLLDLAGAAMAPQFYVDKTTHDLAWLRIFTSLTYLNEVWGLSIMSFSNVPYWSLCYEMWYYVLFAIATFTKGPARFWLLGATLLFLGPKILVLAPIWVLGVVLHRSRRLAQLAPWQGWLLFLASWPAYALFQHFDLSAAGSRLLLELIGARWHEQAAFSRYFITDYLLALIIAANFVGFRVVAGHFSAVLLACERPIRWISSFTFSLYILHQPLLQFFAALINGDPRGKLFYIEVLAATLLGVVVIGSLTEHKRGHLRDIIRRGLLVLTQTAWWRNGVSPVLAPGQPGR
jgi:peptidoglycan/LPS O-acetylase OafA/YrhL